ncbi:hypothetical protein [Enterovirga rhinocerotis]|uniref:Lipoprotein n=1 Tax=Enterovirga rhinocerotis TaxID=1339210 RepID=A0A4R7C8D1_9HYPH|nr:hypothetical protein [Enterovirga rhinocerotis]TDR94884.1 hypothetical protein EV668_2175 [Enterovirga rhinocerotis]
MSVRVVLAVVLLSSALGACVAGSQSGTAPQATLTPQQQAVQDRTAREMFARLISRHRKYGATNLFSGRRQYVNALVSGPALEENALTGPTRRICAKVLIKNAFAGIDRQVELSASVVDGPQGLTLSMGPDEDLLGARCKGPYVPFPELEAITRQAS